MRRINFNFVVISASVVNKTLSILSYPKYPLFRFRFGYVSPNTKYIHVFPSHVIKMRVIIAKPLITKLCLVSNLDAFHHSVILVYNVICLNICIINEAHVPLREL